MTTHLNAACDAGVYKPASSTRWIEAVRTVFSVLHDIQWWAPWDDTQKDLRPLPRIRSD